MNPKYRMIDFATALRFFQYVDFTDSCHLWRGGLYTNGYGQFNLNNKNICAHRLAWLIAGFCIPSDKPVLRHKCRNRHCVNTEHLEIGSIQENQQDRVRDGTTNRGEQSALAKLTTAKVLEIRSRATESQTTLAEEFNTSPACINHIIHRRRWNHI